MEALALVRQVLDAVDRAQLDALRLVVKIYALDAGVSVNLVGVLTDSHDSVGHSGRQASQFMQSSVIV
jgi:hypothetical protein